MRHHTFVASARNYFLSLRVYPNNRGPGERGQTLHLALTCKMLRNDPDATLQGVDPASPANRLDARTSTRSSFARYEFGGVSHSLGSETTGLNALKTKTHNYNETVHEMPSICNALHSWLQRCAKIELKDALRA